MLVLRAELTSDAPYCTDAAQAGREAALRGLLAALEDHAEREGWSLAFDNVPADDPAMSAACAERGYLRPWRDPAPRCGLNGTPGRTYLKSAARHSKRAATNIRTELNHARRDGLAIAEWSASRDARIGPASAAGGARARLNARDSLFKPGLFASLSEALGGDFKVFIGSLQRTAARSRRIRPLAAIAAT